MCSPWLTLFLLNKFKHLVLVCVANMNRIAIGSDFKCDLIGMHGLSPEGHNFLTFIGENAIVSDPLDLQMTIAKDRNTANKECVFKSIVLLSRIIEHQSTRIFFSAV